jgi:hypothetical protein
MIFMIKPIIRIILLLIVLASGAIGIALAKEVYQEPQAFLQEVFNGKVPKPRLIWITKARRAVIKEILDHKPRSLRIRYWGRDGRTVWILEEIGKELPITTGIVVNKGQIERIKILIFRESRGWEVRYPFFTDQFSGARLIKNYQLNQPIDGITGATLSVRALKKLARLSLYLHQQSNKGKKL